MLAYKSVDQSRSYYKPSETKGGTSRQFGQPDSVEYTRAESLSAPQTEVARVVPIVLFVLFVLFVSSIKLAIFLSAAHTYLEISQDYSSCLVC